MDNHDAAQGFGDCAAHTGAFALRVEPVPVSPLRASIPYRMEHCFAVATADLMAPEYWRAIDSWGTAGYGDTPAEAIAHLERITAWRRT